MRNVAAVLACACVLSGCLTSDVRLAVGPDGSGTINYRMTLTPSRWAAVQKLLPVEPGASPRSPVSTLPQLDEQMAARSAGNYVRPQSSRPIKGVDLVGREMTFEFDDVSKVDLEVLPALPGTLGAFWRLAAAETFPRTRFALSLSPTREGNHLLTIRFPKFAMDPSAEPPGAAVSGSPEEMAQLRSALEGARLRIAVETTTELIRTNSPHREGNEVTLVDIDVEKALFSKQIDMLRAAPASFDEFLSMLEDLPGVKLARDHVVTIEFQGSPTTAQPPTAPPPTEIFLATLERRGRDLMVGTPTNISNSDGYDNQPAFTPDGSAILFTSDRGARSPGPAPSTDIYRYDISTGRTLRITNTPESEYSPTVMPDGKRISVVRVEADGTQRLWSFASDGGTPALLLTDIKPVGYHAWIDDVRLALFVLGQPATLQVADIRTGRADVAARDIGRAIQRMPSGSIAFVQRTRPADRSPRLTLTELSIPKLLIGPEGQPRDVRGYATSSIVEPPAGTAEPYPVWMADGTILIAHDTTLYAWRAGDPGWMPIADLGRVGLSNVTRLAINPKGDRLALVAAGR